MNPCNVTFEELLDYHEQRLADRGPVERHLGSGCTECAERLSWLRQFLPALSSALGSPAPGPSARAAAFARALARTEAPGGPALRTLVAHLVFEGRDVSMPGLRRTGGEPRQRVYEAEAVVVNLWEEPSEESAYLIGQAYSREGTALVPASVEAVSPEGRSWRAEVRGEEFHFPRLAAGSYELLLKMADQWVRLRDVRVGD